MEATTFSQKLKRLEDIVAKLESPDLELEDSLKLLEEGIALHKQCQAILTDSQAKITTLLNSDHPSASQAPEQQAAAPIQGQEELPF